jgi:potassium efflux system protein
MFDRHFMSSLGHGSGRVLFAAFVCLSASGLRAADPMPHPASSSSIGAPATIGASSNITVAEVNAYIKEAQDSTTLAADVKAKVIETCQQALDELRIADDWMSKSTAFRTARLSAPKELEQVKALLAQPLVDPVIPEKATLETLKQGLAQADADLLSAQNEQADLEAKGRLRMDRCEQIRVLDAAATQRLDDVYKQLAAYPAVADGLSPMDRAQRGLLLAKRAKTLAERAAYEQELPSYEARRELMRAKLDLATQQLNHVDAVERKWKDAVADRSRQDADLKARDAMWARETASPEVRPLAIENEQLAELRRSPQGPAAKTKEIEEQVADLMALRAKLQSQFEHIRKIATLTNAVGLLLQKQRGELPNLHSHRRSVRERQTEVADIKLKLIELETKRSDLADIPAQVTEVVDNIDPPPSAEKRRELELAVHQLLETQRDYLDALIADYNNYFNSLVLDLDKNEQELIHETADYASYINERILWIPSAAPLGAADLGRSWDAAVWLTDRNKWLVAGQALWDDAIENPLVNALAAATALAMLLAQRRLRRRVREIGEQCARNYSSSFLPTLEALALTVAISLLWPAVLWFLAWRLSAAWDAPQFAKTVAFALQVTAIAFLTTELMRQVCRRKGLAEIHFGWPEANVRALRQNLPWLLVVGLPITFVVSMIQEQDNALFNSSLGRLTFIVGLILLTVFAWRVLRPGSAPISNELAWLHSLRYLWYPLRMGVPPVLAILAALGYIYTAVQLTWRLEASLWLFLGVLLAHSLALRWLLVARRKLAIHQSRQRRAAAQLCSKDKTPPAVGEALPHPVADAQVELTANHMKTRRLLHSAFLLALGVGCWGIWVDVLPALKFVDQWKVWSYTETVSEAPTHATGTAAPSPEAKSITVTRTHWITLGDLVASVVIILMTFIGSRNLPGLLEIAWLQRLPLDAGGRYALTSLSRYVLTLVGIVAASQRIGIGWENVQWLAAAITLGLGFGLQEIFANFVSGLIILFERPMRVGDIVTVGGVSGTVSRIRSRATTITDWDRKELIVPNKEFITGQLVNWTLSDSVLRLVIKIGVAYGSDTELATKLLMDAAQAHPLVLKSPPPTATFIDFGASALNFELHVFLSGPDHFSSLRHELNTIIDRSFREAGIEMAFPQCDLHLRTVPPTLSLAKGRDEKLAAAIFEQRASA